MQISLDAHLARCAHAMRRMKAKNEHREVIDHSAQIIVTLATQLAETQTRLAALEAETKRIVVTDG